VIRLAPRLIVSCVLLAGAHSAVAQPAAPFRIAVLAGEDSVNVIQQKTAVAPLVEVRDRNNNPVSGALVTFAVQGGKSAAFQGGATTLTVATNAAGQAAATGLTPLTAGAVNISVEAAFQGQVVSAAISQVNVLTAAEAAAVAGGASSSGASSGGAAGGTGGGISGTTIGIIGGVVAAGAVAGTQVLGGGPDVTVFRGAFSMNGTLSFGACSRQENYSGTLVLELGSTTGTITGNGDIVDATGRVTAATCPGMAIGPIGDGRWGMPDGPVTGTDASMIFQVQDVVTPLDGNGTLARTFKFTGSLSGSTITGQIEMQWRPSVPNVPILDVRTPVTLQRQ
jgi:hypothetical protein